MTGSAEAGSDSNTSVPRISAAPIYARTGVRRRSSARACARGRKRTSKLAALANCEVAKTAPRLSSLRSTPTRFAATRAPPSTRSRFSPNTCKLRTRTSRSSGVNQSRSPSAISPCINVPVTIVPSPGKLKTRSIGRYGGRSGARGGSSASAVWMAARSSGNPKPVSAETATTGALCAFVPCVASRTSSLANSRSSSVTVSALLKTTIVRCTFKYSRIARCSRVCGRGPSFAATTSSKSSIPAAPASMLCKNRSCPGTSTMPASRPSSKRKRAKPRSSVMPRKRSSSQRSGSVPVSARTRVDLP